MDKMEKDLTKASDGAYIRALDSAGNSILISKADMVEMIRKQIKVGGRNYIILSKLNSYTPYNTPPTYSGNIITTKLVRASEAGMNFTISISGYVPTVGETYTISGIMKNNGNPVTKSMWLDKAATTYNYPLIFNVDDSTGKFEITTKYQAGSTWLLHTKIQGSVNDIITIEDLKFEKGNIPTDWTPAPEDIDNTIAALTARVAVLEAK